MTSKRVTGPALLLMLLIVAIDQLTKWLVVENLEPRTAYPVFGNFFRLFLIRNPGAAFSMGVDATLIFSVIQIAATVVCLIALFRARSWWTAVPAILIGSGAAGNLIDRIFRAPGALHGHVVDFLSFGSFAIFNIADSAITVGVVVYLLFALFVEPRRHKSVSERANPPAADGDNAANDECRLSDASGSGKGIEAAERREDMPR
ncbi:signal peptidase II [Corynebacterium anserum]|uniref:Lipoprotein signal peptidase n=1 Tax=Corynebacterium anserum TaxID=2684406 RepID=A0A7G7YMZ9_9CORY|nr:signal peptidase II [Corynebacterium anserum]QNH95869.1 signal peptidase II [Corynebacterium anserum]